jgi:hypothetical protein
MNTAKKIKNKKSILSIAFLFVMTFLVCVLLNFVSAEVLNSGTITFSSANAPLYNPPSVNDPNYQCNSDGITPWTNSNGIFPVQISDNTKFSPGKKLKILNPSGQICTRVATPESNGWCKMCGCRNVPNYCSDIQAPSFNGLKDYNDNNIKIGFYSSNSPSVLNLPIAEYSLNQFTSDGITIPAGTNFIFVYYKEELGGYFDNNIAYRMSFNYEVQNVICSSDSQCNDNNPNTEDKCNNPGTVQSSCVHNNIACFSNAQCGRDAYVGNKYCKNGSVYQDYEQFSCSNPTTSNSQCSSNIVQKLVQGCANGCTNGACTIIVCSQNSDCNDNDLYTEDKCNNPGTAQSSCSNTEVNCVTNNDCGITGLFGNEFCSLNDVFKNFKDSKCMNPGTTQSYCNVTILPKFLVDCGESSCGNYFSNYCKNGSVYNSRNCNNKGCLGGGCYSSFVIEENLVQSCAFGCSNGICKPECSSNSDCPTGKTCVNSYCIKPNCSSNADCNDNNVNTEDKCNNPGTTQSSCVHNPIMCFNDIQCGVSSFLNQSFCKEGNVFDKFVVYKCNNPGIGLSSCSSSIEDKNIKNCLSGCSLGNCLPSGCTQASQCGSSYKTDKYCNGNDVYQDSHDYLCEVGKCKETQNPKLVQSCANGCSLGRCKSSGGHSVPEESTETAKLVISNTLKTNVQESELSIESYLNQTAPSQKIGLNKSTVFSNNYGFLWFVLVGVIILLIILIIVIFVLTRV